MSETIDGTVIVDATLTGLDAQVFVDELRRLTDAQRHADVNAGVVRTARQRRAAALIEMATRSASTPPAPAGHDRCSPCSSATTRSGTSARPSAGRVISARRAGPAPRHRAMEVVLFDDAATVISVSPRRTFTGALRRAIEVRDRHCQHPAGCDIPAERCDVDHIDSVDRRRPHRPVQRPPRMRRPQPPHQDLHDAQDPAVKDLLGRRRANPRPRRSKT